MERWCETNALGSLHGRCRVHRAEILRLRGRCDEAADQALMACEELRPYLRRELGWPLAELGRIRFRQADLPGAEEALLAAHRTGWDPQPDLALLHLAQDDPGAALSSIRDAVDRPLQVPSKERPPSHDLQRAPLLEAQVVIEIATGDLDRARSAAEALHHIATRFQSKALTASAALARGRVRLFEGDATGAEQTLSEAVSLWHEVGAPYEAALARVELAEAHRATGSDQRAALEDQAAQALLEGIRTTSHAESSVEVTPGETHAEDPPVRPDVFRREGDFWTVTFDGRTVRVRDLKGMRYLARLLVDPGQEHHVLELVAGESSGRPAGDGRPRAGQPHPELGDAGALLDTRAKEAYRRRLAEIDDDIEQARHLGDLARAAQADAERDFLTRELARAFGLDGRPRRAGSASERARAGVTRALRHAIARIDQHDPRLGAHLRDTIRTGTYCAYVPDQRVPCRWQS